MNNKTHVPLVHISRRAALPWYKAWAIRAAAIVLALIVCGVITALFTGEDPFALYLSMIEGAFGSSRRIWALLQSVAILLCVSLAVTPAFKMRFWNIGGEGQIMAGCLATAACMIVLRDVLPNWLLIVTMLVTSIIAGGVWGLIPAFFKAKWNTNETLFTLMMNYIAIGIVAWLQGGPWEGRKGSQLIPMFSDNARIPTVLGVHCGWIIALILVLLMYVYMTKTKQGYEIAVIGDSVNTARYAGMNVGWIVMRTMFLSGAISGIVGFIIVSGANFTLYKGVANGVGFTSISIAWLSQLNSFAMIAISMMLAVLEKGANTLQTRMQIPASIADIITGILLFCMLSSEFFINYRLIIRRGGRKEEQP